MADMDVEEFQRYGHQLIDWMGAYLAGAEHYPVLSGVVPGAVRASLPDVAPLDAEPMDTILSDIERLILPGITHWNAPGFMGYFGVTSSCPSILAEMFDAVLNVGRFLWRTAPAATELEQVVLAWLRQALGLPADVSGMIHHNSAIVHALVAARESLGCLSISQFGLVGRSELPRLRIYASQEAHISIDKAAIVLGLGRESVRKIPTDGFFRMDTGALEAAIQEDRHAGWLPFFVVATVGTTSTTSIDPVSKIAAICQRQRLWLHIDAAYAGSAALLPEKRWILAGCEHADSLTFNPHKWLFTSLGCSIFFTRHPDLLKAALALTPAYLQSPDMPDDVVPNLMDYDFALPYRFPALKLWMVIRYFGLQGLSAHIQEHCQLAACLAQLIDASSDFERLAPTPLSVVCFRAHPPDINDALQLDLLNERVIARVNAGGRYFLSHTRLHGKYTLRVAIGNIRTTEQHVSGIWSEIQAAMSQEARLIRASGVECRTRVHPSPG